MTTFLKTDQNFIFDIYAPSSTAGLIKLSGTDSFKYFESLLNLQMCKHRNYIYFVHDIMICFKNHTECVSRHIIKSLENTFNLLEDLSERTKLALMATIYLCRFFPID